MNFEEVKQLMSDHGWAFEPASETFSVERCSACVSPRIDRRALEKVLEESRHADEVIISALGHCVHQEDVDQLFSLALAA